MHNTIRDLKKSALLTTALIAANATAYDIPPPSGWSEDNLQAMIQVCERTETREQEWADYCESRGGCSFSLSSQALTVCEAVDDQRVVETEPPLEEECRSPELCERPYEAPWADGLPGRVILLATPGFALHKDYLLELLLQDGVRASSILPAIPSPLTFAIEYELWRAIQFQVHEQFPTDVIVGSVWGMGGSDYGSGEEGVYAFKDDYRQLIEGINNNTPDNTTVYCMPYMPSSDTLHAPPGGDLGWGSTDVSFVQMVAQVADEGHCKLIWPANWKLPATLGQPPQPSYYQAIYDYLQGK